MREIHLVGGFLLDMPWVKSAAYTNYLKTHRPKTMDEDSEYGFHGHGFQETAQRLPPSVGTNSLSRLRKSIHVPQAC